MQSFAGLPANLPAPAPTPTARIQVRSSMSDSLPAFAVCISPVCVEANTSDAAHIPAKRARGGIACKNGTTSAWIDSNQSVAQSLACTWPPRRQPRRLQPGCPPASFADTGHHLVLKLPPNRRLQLPNQNSRQLHTDLALVCYMMRHMQKLK